MWGSLQSAQVKLTQLGLCDQGEREGTPPPRRSVEAVGPESPIAAALTPMTGGGVEFLYEHVGAGFACVSVVLRVESPTGGSVVTALRTGHVHMEWRVRQRRSCFIEGLAENVVRLGPPPLTGNH